MDNRGANRKWCIVICNVKYHPHPSPSSSCLALDRVCSLRGPDDRLHPAIPRRHLGVGHHVLEDVVALERPQHPKDRHVCQSRLFPFQKIAWPETKKQATTKEKKRKEREKERKVKSQRAATTAFNSGALPPNPTHHSRTFILPVLPFPFPIFSPQYLSERPQTGRQQRRAAPAAV